MTRGLQAHTGEEDASKAQADSKSEAGCNTAAREDVREEKTGAHHDNQATASNKTTEPQPRRFHPFVYWTQTRTHISLQVNLMQAENVSVIRATQARLEFSATGKGAHGLQDYQFSLDLYAQVNSNITCQPIERYVLILIEKSGEQVNWPRLTSHTSKLPWLRVDFDRFLGDNTDDESDHLDNQADFLDNSGLPDSRRAGDYKSANRFERRQQDTSIINRFGAKQKQLSYGLQDFDIFNPFNRRTRRRDPSDKMKYDYRKEASPVDNSKNTAKHASNLKKTYLFLYNVVMLIMFLKVLLVLTIKGLGGTADDDTIERAALIVKMLTITQLLESVHPILGLVPGGPLMPFTQVFGRLVVNYFLTEPSVRINSAPYAHYLFIVWSSIEIFRYSFYALRVFKVNIYPITWCRYTLFLPLYPMGGFCESMVVLTTIKHHERLAALSLSLPNPLNISFSFSLAMKIYTYILLGPTIYYLMCYMWRQRCKQLKEKVA